MSLLDLSAAFDTLDPAILLKRLEITFGIHGIALQWFASYLKDRTQSVLVEGQTSDPSTLKYGVPQGSVLGPVLFTLYSQPLSDVLNDHGCDFHKYADDTKISVSASVDQFADLQASTQSCIEGVLAWMTSNKLNLNTDKTEVMPVGAQARLSAIKTDSITLPNPDHLGASHTPGTVVKFQRCVKYLGVKIDQTLSMQDQISSVCQGAYLQLRRIASVRPYLSKTTAERLVQALVTSRLDYCNAALAGVPAEQVQRLQRVQNDAARLILRKRRMEHVTPLLQQLHWLPVKDRIAYKLATLAYRHFDGTLPPYLSVTLTTYQPPRELRSSGERLLTPPVRNMKTVGDRAFSFLAPAVWNSLPCDLRDATSLPVFKTHLKTHLFKAFLTREGLSDS